MDIWESMLDNRYDCRVVRIGQYQGKLTVKDTNTDQILLSEDVGLMYDAQFGPDIADVLVWQDKCIAVVPDPES